MMRRALAYLPGTLLAVAVLIVLGAASQWTIDASSEDALVRLSWRIEPVRVESCRTLSETELAEVPAHMRRAETCTGGAVDYELRLDVDGVRVRTDTIAPSGLRRDRPIYVYYDHPVAPGLRDISVGFGPIIDEPGADTVPDHTWAGELELAPREIGLVTLSADATRLERRGR